MKTLKLLFFSFCLVTFIYAADSESTSKTDHIKVQLLEEIKISTKTGDVKSKIMLENETSETNNYLLVGEYKTTKMLSGKTKVDIVWKTAKQGQAESELKEDFTSTLLTKEDIYKTAEFKAVGDHDQLNDILNSLSLNAKSKIEDKEDKELLAEVNDLEDTDTTTNNTDSDIDLGKSSNSSDNTTTGSTTTGSSDYQDSGYTYSDDTSSSDTTTDDTSSSDDEPECNYEVIGDTVQFKKAEGGKCVNNGTAVPLFETTDGCTPKINYDAKTVQISTKKTATFEGEVIDIENCSLSGTTLDLKSTFTGCDILFRKDKVAQVQQEQFYYTYNNEDIKVGECVDSETKYDVSTFLEYNKICEPLIDYENKKVQFAFRKVANVDDTLIELLPCQYESVKNTLYSTYDDAGIVDDFVNNESIQYEKFYYMFENKRVYVGEAQPSDIRYTHYLTDQTCEPERVSDDTVIYNQRIAYKDNNGIINYITECKPYSDNEIAVLKEFGGYQHDFVNNQSYPLTREYFIHPDSKTKVYLTEFSKEAKNFPHIKEHDHWDLDDEKLYGTEYVKYFFKDDVYANQNVYLDGDEEDGTTALSPTPYVKILENVKLNKNLGFQRLAYINGKYSLYSDNTKVIDHGNGLYPTNKAKTVNLTSLRKESLVRISNGNSFGVYDPTHKVSYGSCSAGDIKSTTKSYSSYKITGSALTCIAGCIYKTISYNKSYTHKDCIKWAYYENISAYNKIVNYLRPDGTTYDHSTDDLLYRIVK